MELLNRICSAYMGENSDLIKYLAGQIYRPLWEFWQRVAHNSTYVAFPRLLVVGEPYALPGFVFAPTR
jgi:hypothetical protein